MRAIVLVWPFMVGASALACATTPLPPAPPQAPVEEPDEDLSPYPDDEPAGVAAGESCARAGRRLWQLRCAEARRTVGMTFPAFCRSRGSAIDAACIDGATTRAELRARCHVRCLPR